MAKCVCFLHYVFLNALDAAYRFYRTKCEEESAKRRGTEGTKKTVKRRHERIVRVGFYTMQLHVFVMSLFCITAKYM